MNFRLPSIPVQILVLILILLAGSSLFIRFYFLDSVSSLNKKLERFDNAPELRELVNNLSHQLPDSTNAMMKNSVRNMLNRDRQKTLALEFHQRDLIQYSVIILVFMALILSGITLFVTRMITQPIAELILATNRLSGGDLSTRVKEHTLSPLNTLLISFNGMVEDLEFSRQQLVRAEKEIIWKEMARALAHEIKNPITPIRLTLDRIESMHETNSGKLLNILLPSLSVVREEVASLENLALEFAQFARLPEPRLENIDMEIFTAEVLKSYRDKISICLENNSVNTLIYADKLQFRQVLNNLVQNAIEAQADKMKITFHKKNDELTIQLLDNGIGIDIKNIEKIFEPYVTLRKKGTGLGLAISRRIIMQLGGRIEVSSIKNKGTTFTIILPGILK